MTHDPRRNLYAPLSILAERRTFIIKYTPAVVNSIRNMVYWSQHLGRGEGFVDFYIRQKVFSFGDKYNVFDVNENLLYKVQGEVFTFGAKLHLCSPDGTELLYIEQELFHMMPRYSLYCRGVLVASIRKRFTLFGHSLTVESGYGHFEIDGSVFGMDFTIAFNGRVVGTISKEWLTWGDTYRLHIADDWGDPPFLCAMLIAIDNCVHNENS